ncbi:MarR family transcriptional regulator [Streptomyces luteolifulvus]|uniref:MarR family transcriptional regulator n=1 Tax=Streptomyces luteolifulvus TaxID=2615112 RepID=A0A6H9V344_9ACTN|nr:MarR family transcriptional regulator [Streptomyces luteolifulvus]KAB1147722.1 MarR family transcriptional regulator [Streptomyces luteolifulvus]
MSDIQGPLDRFGHDLLVSALVACAREEFSGELRVSGMPGGTFHLRGGLVVAVESPGAPGPEALLLRSGRVSGEEWAGLVREAGGARWPAAGLITRGYAGAAQLRVVCAMALHDAVFAIVAGRVDGCERGLAAEPFTQVAVGEPPIRLLHDAARKLLAITSLPHPVRPDRERPRPVPDLAAPLTALQRELHAQADGRSTCRDLAFRSGRGVYTVTVEIARMLGEGFLVCEGPPPIPVRAIPEGQGVHHRKPPAYPPPQPPPVPAALPRRRPGGFFRLRNGTRNEESDMSKPT